MCSHSKPWWNNNLTTAFKDMRATRDMVRSYYQHFNCQSELMILEAHHLCKEALHMVKTAKCEYYLKLTEGANTQNMWSFCKWTVGKQMYTSPALLRGEGIEPAGLHSDKSQL